MKNRSSWPLLLFLLCPLVGFGQGIPAAEAYRPSVSAKLQPGENLILLSLHVDPRYHITDRKYNFFKVELDPNPFVTVRRVDFPKGVPYNDEEVFKGDVRIRVLLERRQPLARPLTLQLAVSFQICQEWPQELCFPPDQTRLGVTLEPGALAASAARPAESFSQRLERILKGDPRQAPLLFFPLIFLAGLLTSLTPCVYPVIPIVMGFVGARSGGRRLKGLLLSLFFVLGLALVYSILGVAAALSGSLIGVSFQNPIVVGAIATIFIAMGLSMAGLFDIPVPASISSRLGQGRKSELLSALVIGGISAVIAAPCVGPVLIALLSWISQTRNLVLGFLLTFVFSLGLSVIFLVAGTFSGVIAALPRGGKWMETVKHLFAVLLLGSGLYFLGTILPGWLSLALWGVLLLGISVWMGFFSPLGEENSRRKLLKLLVTLIFLAGAFLLFQGLQNHFFAGRIAAGTTAPARSALPWLNEAESAFQKAKSENKRLMLDSYADWCAACIELDEKTFSRPEAAEALKEFVLLRLDLTQKNEANEKLRQRFAIIGMPTVIFFSPEGKEIKRFSGFLDIGEFLLTLKDL